MRLGPYELLGELGRGGCGIVYRARSPDGRDLAVKVLLGTNPDALARFERERRLLASLGEDQGFVPLLAAGESPKGPYLVMPLVPGGTLRLRLNRGALPIDETVRLGRALAAALSEAHARGIVHRDLKPENVLFAADGRPLVADLGLARHFRRDVLGASQSVVLSTSGAFLGTPAYASPEQIDSFAHAGPAADVFSLGAILYECLAGRPPFVGDSLVEVLLAITRGRVEPLRAQRPDAPHWLTDVIEKAMARDVRDRFPDALALRHALARGRAKRRTPRFVAGAFALGLGIGVVVAFVPRGRPAPPPALPGPAAPPVPPAEDEVARLLREGDERLRARDLDGAARCADRALALDPARPAAWLLRGTVHSLRGASAEAVSAFTRALALDPKHANAYVKRAAAHLAEQGFAAAERDATRALELEPALAAAWEMRGLARTRTGDKGGALADLSRAAELWPDVASYRAALGSARLEAGDAPGALEALTRATELAPEEPFAYRVRAGVRRELGDVAGELADIRKGIALAPREPIPPEVRARLAELEKKAASDPTSAGGQAAAAALARGKAAAARQDLVAALLELTRAIELAPSLSEAWGYRAMVRLKQEDFRGTAADAARATELDPGWTAAWHLRATAEYRAGRLDAALALYAKVLEMTPEDVTAWQGRAAARTEGKDLRGAVADYSQAIVLDPRDGLVYSKRGILRLKLGDRAGAVADLETGLGRDPAYATGRLALGLAKEEQGDARGAIVELERFLAEFPGDGNTPTAREHLARLRARR